MIGLPYLDTVAACTGPMIGMTAPSESPTRFNWARVLRHEMTHVITLQQTHYNVPHWYTEALAVWCEGYPRPPEWNELLVQRVPAGKLFTLDTINFAFTSPNSGADWQMAYCQAELYVEYMLQGRGEEVLRKLLDAYTENLSTAEGIRRVFGMSQEKFEQGYVAYLKKLAAELSAGEPPSATWRNCSGPSGPTRKTPSLPPSWPTRISAAGRLRRPGSWPPRRSSFGPSSRWRPTSWPGWRSARGRSRKRRPC